MKHAFFVKRKAIKILWQKRTFISTNPTIDLSAGGNYNIGSAVF